MVKFNFLKTKILWVFLAFCYCATSSAQIPLSFDVENRDDGCNASAGPLANNPNLPDPFEFNNGSRVASYDDWSCRRNEIKADLETYELGAKPARPTNITANYSGGTLTVTVTENGRTLTLTSNFTMPSGAGPHPIVIGMDGPTGSLASSLFNGVVQVPFTSSQLATGTHTGTKNLNDPFYAFYPNLSSAGKYLAWSWGVSRLIDGLEIVADQYNLDMSRVAVSGCSYAGKMALFAGALDERVALTIAQESGGGGINSWRTSQDFVTRTGTNVEKIDNTNGSWFLSGLTSRNPYTLPHDHHELIAMIAPRAFLTLGNATYGDWLGDESGYKSTMAALEVWKAMGIEDRFGFDFSGGHQHCEAATSQNNAVAAFVNKFLKNDNSANTNIRTEPSRSDFDYNWQASVDWTTPALSADPTTGSDDNIIVRATGVEGDETLELEIDGQVVETWTLGTSFSTYTYDGPSTGTFRLNYTNDEGDRDVQIDYLEVDGTRYEAEDQQINTGSYANGACGGGEYTEMMYCSGYIEFNLVDPTVDSDNDGTPDVDDECPNDPNKTETGDCGCGVAENDCDPSQAYKTNIVWEIPGGDQGLAACKAKFLGNIIPSSWTINPIIQPNWGTYWNQMSQENAGKWGVVEGNRDQYNWTDLDVMYDYCEQNDIPFKHHVFIWGSQQPEWLAALPAEEQREEVEEWYSLFKQRYPNTAVIDVVNESLPGHAPDVAARDAMGGFNNGASISYLANHPYLAQFGYGTGWDYIIYAFAKARDYFPDAILVLNDYNIINNVNNINAHLEIVNILKERNLIDAVGIQSHAFSVDNLSAAALQSNLDRLAQAGLPIHVTELDIRGDNGNEQQQLERYQRLLPIFYEHPAVAGVTLWGYVEGQNWFDYTGILNADGTERAAMTWLKQYMAGIPDVCNLEPNNDNIIVRARGALGGEQVELIVDGQVLTTWTLTATNANYTFEGPSTGIFRLNYINDDTDMDVIIDYLEVDDTRYQAEDQEVNTGYYANGECGGAGFSETMHCDGYISFNVDCDGDLDGDGVCDKLVTGFENYDSKAINVYPNPTSGVVQLSKESDWVLYDALGVLLQQGKGTSVDLSAKNSGVYVLKLGAQVVKIIKQ